METITCTYEYIDYVFKSNIEFPKNQLQTHVNSSILSKMRGDNFLRKFLKII